MQDVVMPSIGVAMTEGTLSRWLKAPGDDVAPGEIIAEIETDKASVQIESPVAGRLGPHLHPQGATVPVDEVLVRVLEAGDPEPVPEPVAQRAPVAAPPAAGPPTAGARTPHRLTPRARRIAREHGIPFDAIAGAGRARDVLDHLERTRAERAPAADFRSLIAARVSEAWRTIPHFAVTREIGAEAMVSTLGRLREGGADVSVTDLLLRALALALRETRRGRGDDLGLAVATERGVVIPVVRGVLGLDYPRLGAERRAAVERARAGRLSPGDLEATPESTLSNLGAFGVDQFTGVIATGQTTLLTVGRIKDRVVADGRTIAIEKTLYATLNVDHRALDGADAGRVLEAFASILEDERRMEATGD